MNSMDLLFFYFLFIIQFSALSFGEGRGEVSRTWIISILLSFAMLLIILSHSTAIVSFTCSFISFSHNATDDISASS